MTKALNKSRYQVCRTNHLTKLLLKQTVSTTQSTVSATHHWYSTVAINTKIREQYFKTTVQ